MGKPQDNEITREDVSSKAELTGKRFSHFSGKSSLPIMLIASLNWKKNIEKSCQEL